MKQKRFNTYHRYFRISGLYKLLEKSILKIMLISIFIILIMITAQDLINNLDEKIKIFLLSLNSFMVYSIFLLSESLLGLIPPDFFILWAGQYEDKFLILNLLALLSYIGGIISFKIGCAVRTIPRLKKYLQRKYDPHLDKIRKWGGFFIMFAALFPLPFSAVAMAAGLVKYPFQRLLLYGLTRFLRFYIYAAVLFKVL